MAITPNVAVNVMTGKMHIWLTALPLSLCVMSAAIANEPKINEHKNNRTGDVIINADNVRHADRHTAVDVDTEADLSEQHADRVFSAPHYFIKMQLRRSETQQVQKEAYQRYLNQQEERKQIMDRVRITIEKQPAREGMQGCNK